MSANWLSSRNIAGSLISLMIAGTATAGPLDDADLAEKSGDYATALRLIQPLAQQGIAEAQKRLGVLYESGRGVTKNYAEAEKWFQRAAAQNDLDAIWNIGIIHHRGQGGYHKDFSEA